MTVALLMVDTINSSALRNQEITEKTVSTVNSKSKKKVKMTFLIRFIAIFIIILLTLGFVVLSVWDAPRPTERVEKTLSN